MFSVKDLQCCVTDFKGRQNVRKRDTFAQMEFVAAGMVGKWLRSSDLTADNGLSTGARSRSTWPSVSGRWAMDLALASFENFPFRERPCFAFQEAFIAPVHSLAARPHCDVVQRNGFAGTISFHLLIPGPLHAKSMAPRPRASSMIKHDKADLSDSIALVARKDVLARLAAIPSLFPWNVGSGSVRLSSGYAHKRCHSFLHRHVFPSASRHQEY